MASVEIVTIGTEILLGHMIDTNSVFIAKMLADHGVDVYAKHSVGDNAERLARMLGDALERADGVITTGGLGPTVDDLTKDAVASAVGLSFRLFVSRPCRDTTLRSAKYGRATSQGPPSPAPAINMMSPGSVCECTSAAIRRNGSAFALRWGRMLAWAFRTVYRTIQTPRSQLAVSRLRPAR